MRHLMLGMPSTKGYLALLRPLPNATAPVTAKLIEYEGAPAAVVVTGAGIDDVLWMRRTSISGNVAGTKFEGRYGGAMVRSDSIELYLGDAGLIERANVLLESDGPVASLRLGKGDAVIYASGTGIVTASIGGRRSIVRVTGEPITVPIDSG